MIDDIGKTQQRRPEPARNWPHLVKWIILILLVLLLFAELWSGEFGQIREMQGISWLILLFKLLLIALVIWLMRLQKNLICEITAPKGCALAQYDPDADKLIIVVEGTAAGSAFASYSLSIEQSGSTLPLPIEYPGGGSSGSAAVVNGELGRIDITGIEPGPGFTVRLVVSSSSTYTKTCTSNFDIQDKVAYIEEIGEVPAQVVGAHPADPTEPLKLVKDNPGPPSAAEPEVSVGGSISVEGGADLYGCGRQMVRWELGYQEVLAGNDPFQADDPGPWANVIAPVPISQFDANHPRRYLGYFGTLLPNFVLNGVLTRKWVTKKIFQYFNLGPPITAVYADRRVTDEQGADWVTNPGGSGNLNGYYTVRLQLTHDVLVGPSSPSELYDAATVWVDNRGILVQITGLGILGGKDLDACAPIRLSALVSGGSKSSLELKGRAWDPIILDSYPVARPNDNFQSYDLRFKKDGGVAWIAIAITHPTLPLAADVPVPPVRATTLPAAPGDVGVLTAWDLIGAVDAGPAPPGGSPPAAYPKLYRGESCAYLVRLHARDSTRVNDSSTHHHDEFFWPFCLINDLPEDLTFPVP